MSPAAVAIFAAAVICWGLGLLAGYHMGRKQRMTKKEAASIMAKASWKTRRHPRAHLPVWQRFGGDR